MANYSYTSNGIDFTIEGNDVMQFSKLTNADGSLKRGDIVPLINAVEIDWNGAVLPAYSTTGLNTTGEVLSKLKFAI